MDALMNGISPGEMRYRVRRLEPEDRRGIHLSELSNRATEYGALFRASSREELEHWLQTALEGMVAELGPDRAREAVYHLRLYREPA